jgi:hypothetical protein
MIIRILDDEPNFEVIIDVKYTMTLSENNVSITNDWQPAKLKMVNFDCV